MSCLAATNNPSGGFLKFFRNTRISKWIEYIYIHQIIHTCHIIKQLRIKINGSNSPNLDSLLKYAQFLSPCSWFTLASASSLQDSFSTLTSLPLHTLNSASPLTLSFYAKFFQKTFYSQVFSHLFHEINKKNENGLMLELMVIQAPLLGGFPALLATPHDD